MAKKTGLRSDGISKARVLGRRLALQTIDLRGTLSHAAGYKRDWANELHPAKSGFSSVATRLPPWSEQPTSSVRHAASTN